MKHERYEALSNLFKNKQYKVDLNTLQIKQTKAVG